MRILGIQILPISGGDLEVVAGKSGGGGEIPLGDSQPFSGSGTPSAETPSQRGVLFGWIPRLGCAGAIAALTACSSTTNNDGGGGAPLWGHREMTAERVIGGVPIVLAPANATPEQKYQHYRNIAIASGGRFSERRPHVLAIRGAHLRNRTISSTTANPLMQDTIVVLKKDPNVGYVAIEFLGSTHPGQKSTDGIGRDVTGDGVKDVGMVSEGIFRASPNGDFLGAPSYYVLKTNGRDGLPSVRDTNQDGIHSPEEWAASRSRGDRSNEILFHTGHGEYVASVGCFNVARFTDFVTTLGENTTFDVTLVNAAGPEPR